MQFHQHFTTIDTHSAGEPLRIIVSGIPDIKGSTMLEKRRYFTEHFDDIRKLLMYEPRGHHGMYGCIVTPPVSEEAEFGVLFLHSEGQSTMCGHGIIAVVTALIETGRLRISEEKTSILIDSPAGLITAKVHLENKQIHSVSFINVPSFLYKKDVRISVNGMECQLDIAFGGAFYAIVSAKDLHANVEIEEIARLQAFSKEIKKTLESQFKLVHPNKEEIQGLYGVIFTDSPKKANSYIRSVTIFADRQIDRSPCGTGTAALLAVNYSRGKLTEHEAVVNESIIGSQFTGEIVDKTMVGRFDAVIPQITGKAFVTGFHQFIVDPADPLAAGFLLK